MSMPKAIVLLLSEKTNANGQTELTTTGQTYAIAQ